MRNQSSHNINMVKAMRKHLQGPSTSSLLSYDHLERVRPYIDGMES